MHLKIETFEEQGVIPRYELIFKPEEAQSFIGLIDEKSTVGKRLNRVLNFVNLNSDTTKIVSFDITKRMHFDACFGIEYRKDDLIGKIFLHIYNGRTLSRCEEIVPNDFRKHWRANRKTDEFGLLAFFHKRMLRALAKRPKGDPTIDII